MTSNTKISIGNSMRGYDSAEAISTLKQANGIAKRLGLVKGKGKYNGQTFWVRPGETQIITRQRLAELAGLV